MPAFEWPLMTGAEVLPGVFAMTAILLGLAVATAGVVAFARWRRRRAAVSQTVRAAVESELQRDPALSGLTLTLVTRTPWAGEPSVGLTGTVPSPWYRYAVMRAAARAVARTHHSVRIVDAIAIAERRAPTPPLRRVG
jgi:hypothetical protein